MSGFYENTPEPAAPTIETPVNDAASLLYGPKPAYVDKTVTEAQRAEREAARAESTERTLYDAQKTYTGVLPDDATDVFEDVPAAREIMAQMQVDATDAKELLTAIRQLHQLEKTSADGKIPDDVMLFGSKLSDLPPAKWREASIALTVPAKGTATPQISKADLARAHAYVMRDPRVADMLNRTGLGDHPRVVERVVRLAREVAIRGGKR